MQDSKLNHEPPEEAEQTGWMRFEPAILAGALVVVLICFVSFVKDPGYDALLGIITGITTLLSVNSIKNRKVNWLLGGLLVVSAGVGIAIVIRARDPEQIVIVGIFYDGLQPTEGDEYVILRNEDTHAIQLEGWTLSDDQSNHVFTFPRYSIQPGEECRIYTNEEHSEWCSFNFRNGGSGVWNNDGDRATLRNADGIRIDESETPITGTAGPAPLQAVQLEAILPVSDDDLTCIPRDTSHEVVRVRRVLDGRTIEVWWKDGSIKRVRYLGVATIVKGQPLYERSVAINRELVMGKAVTLVEDPQGPQSGEFLWRYVFVDEIFVNYQLVALGYAVPDTDCSCLEDFINLSAGASELDLGFTGTSAERIYGNPFFDTPPAGYFDQEEVVAINQVVIAEIFYDGVAGAQEPDEFVEIQNKGTTAVHLKDWRLSDQSEHTFEFPDDWLEPGEACRIYTNEEHPAWCGWSFKSSQAIWGNRGDCAILWDGAGEIVDQVCY